MKPVYQTERRERRYTVMRPVYQTVNQRAPVHRDEAGRPRRSMVAQPYTVCRPVTTVRQETVECGYYERQYTTVPGPVVERQVRVPVEECDACGEQPRGLFGCLHKKKVDGDRRRPVPAADGLPAGLRLPAGDPRRLRDPLRPRDDDPPGPGRRCRYVAEERVENAPSPPARWSPRSGSSPTRSGPAVVAEERVEPSPVQTCSYVAEERVEPYEVRTCEMVAEERVETIPVTTCSMVAEERVEPYEVRTCRCVAEERVENFPVTTCSYGRRGADRDRPVTTCRMVAETAARGRCRSASPSRCP